jgi:hypothetical protein
LIGLAIKKAFAGLTKDTFWLLGSILFVAGMMVMYCLTDGMVMWSRTVFCAMAGMAVAARKRLESRAVRRLSEGGLTAAELGRLQGALG